MIPDPIKDYSRMIPVGKEGAATFQTVCEVMGLTVDDVAGQLAVPRHTAARWFGDDGPTEQAADWAEAKWDEFMSLVTASVDSVINEDETREKHGGQVDVVRLGRHRSDAPPLQRDGITRAEHAARVKAIFIALEAAGYRTRVHYLD